jgi:hypothetical protein
MISKIITNLSNITNIPISPTTFLTHTMTNDLMDKIPVSDHLSGSLTDIII